MYREVDIWKAVKSTYCLLQKGKVNRYAFPLIHGDFNPWLAVGDVQAYAHAETNDVSQRIVTILSSCCEIQ